MKKILTLIVAAFIAVPAMAQLATGAVANNSEYNLSDYEKFVTSASQYTKHQVGTFVLMKLVSPATLGGYTIRPEKTIDMVSSKSMQAISLIPNSSTGVGKLISRSTGIGAGARSYYMDYNELTNVKKAIAKMKADSAVVPELYTRYSYTCKGGFTFSCAYLVVGKKSLWVGQVGDTGEMPLGDFFKTMTEALEKVEPEFAKFK